MDIDSIVEANLKELRDKAPKPEISKYNEPECRAVNAYLSKTGQFSYSLPNTDTENYFKIKLN